MHEELPVKSVLDFAPDFGFSALMTIPLRVLLVEDCTEAADLVRASLGGGEPEGEFEVDWASSLVEAVILLSQFRFDVVLLDLGLPELEGYKSYRAVELASRRRTPVVILTADDRNVSRDLTLGFGAADYLLKQEASPARLKSALRKAVLEGISRQVG